MLVAVTGATGFIAQHCIAELLSHGHTVQGTVRNIASATAHNKQLTGLKLFETDLLKDPGWSTAFEGVDAVFHTASPVILTAPEDELIGPAVEGTRRVLKAAAEAGVKRVVLTSSTAAIVNTDAEIYNEKHWSEIDKCKPYPKSKTLAERTAWDFVASLPEHQRFELVACNPCVVFGPPLSDHVSSSLSIIQKLMERKIPALPNIGFNLVDVRDVAIAHRLALETPHAAGNRYLLSSEFYWFKDISLTLHEAFSAQGFHPTTRELPNWLLWLAGLFHPLAKSAFEEVNKRSQHDTLKARSELGWSPRPVKETIVDTGASLITRGLIK